MEEIGDHIWSRCISIGLNKFVTRDIYFPVLRDGIDECLHLTRSELAKLQAEITKSLEKIASRERYIASQLEEPLTMYKQLSHLLAQTKEQYKQVRKWFCDTLVTS